MIKKGAGVDATGLGRFLDWTGLSVPGLVFGIFLVALPWLPPFNKEYILRWLIAALIVGASAIAFDFSGGFIAVINFGFMGFFGLGSYTSALLAIHCHLSPWVTIFIAALPPAILGLLSGLVSLRLRGMMILCFTWFIGLALMGLATKLVFLTRGSLGLPCPTLFKTASNVPYYYSILGMMFVTYLVLRAVIRSHYGLAFRAIGQNMEAARTSGINPLKFRVVNFILACAFAGWIGGFYAHYYGVITPDLMSTAKTTEVLVIAYIGGRGSLWGGAVAAVPFVFAMEVIRSVLSNMPGLNLILYGLFLIFVMLYYPGGLAEVYKKIAVKYRNKTRKS